MVRRRKQNNQKPATPKEPTTSKELGQALHAEQQVDMLCANMCEDFIESPPEYSTWTATVCGTTRIQPQNPLPDSDSSYQESESSQQQNSQPVAGTQPQGAMATSNQQCNLVQQGIRQIAAAIGLNQKR